MKAASFGVRRARTAWMLLSASLAVLVLVAGYPLIRTIGLSFTRTNILQYPVTSTPVGFRNFVHVVTDPSWWVSVRNTVVFTVFSVSIETILGLGVALLVNANLMMKGVMRAAMLTPWAILTVVSAQMWRWMYNDVFGVLNDILKRLHIIHTSVSWLTTPSIVLPAVIAVDVWKTTPFMALLLLAGLQTIPNELYEAAIVDGTTAWQRFVRITLPLLRPALLVALIFRTLDALRVFDVIYVMTGTVPTTMSMSVYARQQLVDFGKLGYGSAVTMFILIIIGVFTTIYVVSLRVEVD